MTNIENNYPQTIKRPNGTFTLSLITESRIFYCNLEDDNVNKNVEVYDRIGKRKMELVAEEFLAYELLMFNLITNRAIYISPTLKKIYEEEEMV
jgi:hypothetical protein